MGIYLERGLKRSFLIVFHFVFMPGKRFFKAVWVWKRVPGKRSIYMEQGSFSGSVPFLLPGNGLGHASSWMLVISDLSGKRIKRSFFGSVPFFSTEETIL